MIIFDLIENLEGSVRGSTYLALKICHPVKVEAPNITEILTIIATKYEHKTSGLDSGVTPAFDGSQNTAYILLAHTRALNGHWLIFIAELGLIAIFVLDLIQFSP